MHAFGAAEQSQSTWGVLTHAEIKTGKLNTKITPANISILAGLFLLLRKQS